MKWARRAAFIAMSLAALWALSVCVLWGVQRSLLYFPDTAIVAPNVPGVEAVHIKTPDGQTLIAWWLPPQAGQPVILFFDGNSSRPQQGSGRWTRIAKHGAGFLAVYYRGYSGSTGKPTEDGLHIDARAGYDWLRAHGVAAQDIVIHGYSLGSGVAVKLATVRPARALILEAPYSAAVDVAAARYVSVPVSLIMQDQFLSRDWIKDVYIPVLIVHGDRDSVVPFSQGERLFALANEPKQFVRMEGSEHTTLARDGLYDYIWPFLDTIAAARPDTR